MCREDEHTPEVLAVDIHHGTLLAFFCIILPKHEEKHEKDQKSYCCCYCYCYYHRLYLLSPTQLEHGHYHRRLPSHHRHYTTLPHPRAHHNSPFHPIRVRATYHATSCQELELNGMLLPTHPSLPSACLPPTSIAGTYRESICSPPFRAPTCSSA